MEEVISKSCVGAFGTLASISLSNVDAYASICVAAVTTIYMTFATIKVIRQLKDK